MTILIKSTLDSDTISELPLKGQVEIFCFVANVYEVTKSDGGMATTFLMLDFWIKETLKEKFSQVRNIFTSCTHAFVIAQKMKEEISKRNEC